MIVVAALSRSNRAVGALGKFLSKKKQKAGPGRAGPGFVGVMCLTVDILLF